MGPLAYLFPWIKQQIQHLSHNSLSTYVHYSDVVMSAMVSEPYIQVHIKENIKAPRQLPFWWEFTGDRRIIRAKGQ